MTRRAIGFALVAVLLLYQVWAHTGLVGRLWEARRKWEQRKPSSYEITIELARSSWRVASTPPVYRVIAGKPELVGELGVESRQLYDHYNTVEKLFSAIEKSFSVSQESPHNKVEYDTDLGFPSVAYLDPYPTFIDFQIGFRVAKFRIIEK